MGSLTITESGVYDFSGVPPINVVKVVGAGGPGTNGWDNGSNGGVGKAGEAGEVRTIENVPLAGALFVQVGQPCPLVTDVLPSQSGGPGETKGGLALSDTTHLGFLVSALGGEIGPTRFVGLGGDNGTDYGAGGPSGSPDEPIDTLGQGGAVLVTWAD